MNMFRIKVVITAALVPLYTVETTAFNEVDPLELICDGIISLSVIFGLI